MDRFAKGSTVDIGVVKEGVSGLVRGEKGLASHFFVGGGEIGRVPGSGYAHTPKGNLGNSEGGLTESLGFHGGQLEFGRFHCIWNNVEKCLYIIDSLPV